MNGKLLIEPQISDIYVNEQNSNYLTEIHLGLIDELWDVYVVFRLACAVAA